MITKERLGRFSLLAYFSSTHNATKICDKLNFVSFRSHFDHNTNTFEYSGLSPLFDEIEVKLDMVALGDIPKYDVFENNGEFTVKKSHILDLGKVENKTTKTKFIVSTGKCKFYGRL